MIASGERILLRWLVEWHQNKEFSIGAKVVRRKMGSLLPHYTPIQLLRSRRTSPKVCLLGTPY